MSSVVGTVLMLAVTVSVFAGFSVVALSYIQDQPDPPRSDLGLMQSSGSLYLLHRGGESFSRGGGTLYVNHNGVQEAIPTSDARFSSLGTTWDVGDQLCIQGNAAGCLYPSSDAVDGAFLVAQGTLLTETGTRASGQLPDLTVALVSQSPTSPGVGSTLTWTVRVSNGGGLRMFASSVLVNVEVDGVVRATATMAGPILVGSSATATSTPAWTATLGTHALRLTVDPSSAVTESTETNNQATSSFSVAAGVQDPGQPFLDANGDGLYTPGVDSTVNAADITDGSYTASSGSLSIPASVGPISAATVSFSAPGNVAVAVAITSTDAPMTISAGGDLAFTGSGLSALQNNKPITLTVGGRLDAPGLTVSVNGAFTVTAGGAVDLSSSSITVTSNNEPMSITGQSVDVHGSTLRNNGNNGNTITITATNGAIAATSVNAQSTGDQAWKSNGGGSVTLDSSTLAATGSNLQACVQTGGTYKIGLDGTLSFTDNNNLLDIQQGAVNSPCNNDAWTSSSTNSYVTPWPASSSSSPRDKVN